MIQWGTVETGRAARRKIGLSRQVVAAMSPGLSRGHDRQVHATLVARTRRRRALIANAAGASSGNGDAMCESRRDRVTTCPQRVEVAVDATLICYVALRRGCLGLGSAGRRR